MKKILLILSLGFLVQFNSYANVISLGTVSADATAAGINDNFTTIANAINGNVQGSATSGSTTNVLADSLGELDMGDEINPRIRAAEVLGITVDTTTSSNAFVYTGLTPATSANLTSDISAGTAYINGYRVVKTATSKTYTASKDTYVDLSQTGVFTYSEVANGGVTPSVAANSARLAKVVTSGTAITSVTDLANRRVPGLIVATDYRSGLFVSRDSATTMKVLPGMCVINNTALSKTASTTLTLTTAGDWAGGTSLQAVSTYGYVGMDVSGNLKMHTTAPTHDNYGVSTTVGKRRYATWSSTVYRILGWFFMNATGSGELNTYEVGNIKEGDVPNTTFLSSGTSVNSNSAIFVNDTQAVSRFYSSGGPVEVTYNVGTGAAGTNRGLIQISVDSAGIAAVERMGGTQQSVTTDLREITSVYRSTLTQAGHTVQGQFRDVNGGDTHYVNNRSLKVEEF